MFFTFSTFLQLGYHRQHKTPLCKQSVLRPIQAIRNRPPTTSLLRTFTQCHLQTFSKNLERSRRDAQLRYVVICGAACSYCLARAERLDGSYVQTFALDLKEELTQTLAAFVTSILAGPHRLDAEEAEEPSGTLTALRGTHSVECVPHHPLRPPPGTPVTSASTSLCVAATVPSGRRTGMTVNGLTGSLSAGNSPLTQDPL